MKQHFENAAVLCLMRVLFNRTPNYGFFPPSRTLCPCRRTIKSMGVFIRRHESLSLYLCLTWLLTFSGSKKNIVAWPSRLYERPPLPSLQEMIKWNISGCCGNREIPDCELIYSRPWLHDVPLSRPAPRSLKSPRTVSTPPLFVCTMTETIQKPHAHLFLFLFSCMAGIWFCNFCQ
jgi:hypothetical protein